MRKVKCINSKGQEINLSYNAPLILQKLELNTGINIYDSKSMNQAGRTYRGNTLDVGELKAQLTILARNKAELNMLKQNIRNVFNPSLGQSAIIHDNGIRKRIIKVIANEMPFFSPANQLEEVCLVNLTAHDPYWQDLQGSKVEIAKWRPNLEFPFDIPVEGLEMGLREPSLIANVNNQGQVKTGLKIRFKALATLENPSLFNINTREYFKINKVMEAGEIIEVTTGFQNKRVKLVKNGVTSTFHNWDYTSSWLQLDTGDNLFRYDADSGLENLEVSIYYTQKYLGV